MKVTEFKEHYDDKLEEKVDSNRAQELARRFLSQYHSVIDTKAVLKDGVWIVTVHLGFSNTQTKQVKIDAETGIILGYT